MPADLKPCPFCGNEELRIDFNYAGSNVGMDMRAYFVWCAECRGRFVTHWVDVRSGPTFSERLKVHARIAECRKRITCMWNRRSAIKPSRKDKRHAR